MRSFVVYFHATYIEDPNDSREGEIDKSGDKWRIIADTLEEALKLFRDRNDQEIYRVDVESKVLIA